MISINFIVKLPESHGYDAIMNVIDSVTKCAHFIPMHTTINAKGTALLFLKEVWKHHGTPRVFDTGPLKTAMTAMAKTVMVIRHRYPIHTQTEASRSFPTYISQVMQNANAMTLCTRKVDDNSLSILMHQTVTTPGDLGLSCL
jgi:hypothetical protein